MYLLHVAQLLLLFLEFDAKMKTVKWSHARAYLTNQSSTKLVFMLMVTLITLKSSDLKLLKL